MAGTDPGTAREEAERLVATLLAAAKLAGAGSGGGGWGPLGGILSGVLGHSWRPGAPTPGGAGGFATGSPECCVCPVCRGIAALRDPSPEFAERLATGAGDLAAGVASLLRALASAGAPPAPTGGASPAPETAPTAPTAGADDDRMWREATRTGHDSQPAPERDVWSAATRAEETAAPATVVPPADVVGPVEPVGRTPADRAVVVPASRSPEGTDGGAPGDGA